MQSGVDAMNKLFLFILLFSSALFAQRPLQKPGSGGSGLDTTIADARYVLQDSTLPSSLSNGHYPIVRGDSLVTGPLFGTAEEDDTVATLADVRTLAGSSNGWTEIARTADTTHNTIVFADIGELQFTMAANGVYEIEGVFFVTRANNANAFTIGLNLSQAPTSVAMQGWGVNGSAAGTDNIKTENIDTYQDTLQLTGATVSVMDKAAWMSGVIVNTSSTTLFKMYWHAEVAGTNNTLKRGSYIRYRRLY
jgi:hypothetical protein